MTKSAQFTTFQWLAPSMARDGLLTNADWVLSAAEEADEMFVDEQLKSTAQFLAVLERFALDYIRQAPVLVVAIAQGRDFKRRSDRLEVGRRFISECRGGMKLAALMRGYGLAPQLRGVKGTALVCGHHLLLRELSQMLPPSTLAQAVPATAEVQRGWLQCLLRWRDHVGRHFRNANLLLDWAAINLRDERAWRAATDVADYAGRNRAEFNLDWSFSQAEAASQRWHEEMAVRAPIYESSRADWRTVIDYGSLPTRIEIDGLTFVALQTRETLYEEGARMHHCVRLYSDRVACGTSRIYGVRRGETRVATLELVRSSRSDVAHPSYRLAQLKGPCNGRPDAATSAAALALLKKINPTRAVARNADAIPGESGARTRTELRSTIGEELYKSWFSHLAFETFDGQTLRVSFPVRFLVRWVETHFAEVLLASCAQEFVGVQRVEVVLRNAGATFPPRAPELFERIMVTPP